MTYLVRIGKLMLKEIIAVAAPPGAGDALLLEDGNYILLEDGGKILL